MRTRLALAAAMLTGVTAVVSVLDGAQEALVFFAAATLLASLQAWVVSAPSHGRRRLAISIALAWVIAGAWIGALLLMYQTASRPEPRPEATYLGMTATMYHLVALYGGMVLVCAAAFLPGGRRRPRPEGST